MKIKDVPQDDIKTFKGFGTKALYATIKFRTQTLSLFGTFVFVNKNGKRLFIAGYNDNGFEPLEQIMKSLTFK